MCFAMTEKSAKMNKSDELDRFHMLIKASKNEWSVGAWVHYDHRDDSVFVTPTTFNKIKKKGSFKGVNVRVGGQDLILITDRYIFRI